MDTLIPPNKLSKFKEKLLLLQLKNRNPEAFAQVYDWYAERIYRFIYFKVSSVETAEDLTSEVFLRIWRYFNKEDSRLESLNALIYKTARNIVIDFYRQQARQSLIDNSYQNGLAQRLVDSQQQNLLDKVEILTEIENIELILKKLKDEYREVLILRFLEELSIAEVAKILDKSKGATRILIHRALKVLKELLDKRE